MALTEIGARLRLAGAPAFSKNAKNSADSLSKLAREAGQANRKIGGLEKTARRAGKAIGLGLAAGVVGLAVAAKGSINAASDLNESLSKSNTVFGSSALAVQAWANDSSKNILLTRQAAIEGAATFGNLFTAMGLGQKPSADLSTKLVGLASDLSSFNNVDTDTALLALRSGLLGEAEPLRAFGVQLSAARVEAEALASGLVKPVRNQAKITAAHNSVTAALGKMVVAEKKYGKTSIQAKQAGDGVARAQEGVEKALKGTKVVLTAAQKAQASYAIIMKDTKTAQGDAARTADGYANSTRIMNKNIADARAEIGKQLLPAVTGLANYVNKELTPKIVKLADEFKRGAGTGGEIRAGLVEVRDAARDAAPYIKDVYEATKSVVEFMIAHPDVVKVAAVGVASFAVAMKAASLYSKSMAAVDLIKIALGISAVGTASTAAAGGAAVGGAAKAGGIAGLAARMGGFVTFLTGPFGIAMGTAIGLFVALRVASESASNAASTIAGLPTATIGPSNGFDAKGQPIPGYKRPVGAPPVTFSKPVPKLAPRANNSSTTATIGGASLRTKTTVVIPVQLNGRQVGSAVIDDFEDRVARR